MRTHNSRPGIGKLFFFFVKDQVVNTLSFASSVVSVTTLQFDHCGEEAERTHTQRGMTVFPLN